jgi:replication factor A1
MKISELKAGQGKVDVECKIKSKAEPRVMEKYGKELKVANAVVADDSGEIALTLWNDDVDKVKVEDTIRITNGYVSEFNGKKQLTSGKFGKLEVVGKTSDEPAAEVKEKKPKEAKKEKAKKEEAEPEEESDEKDMADDLDEVEF